MKNLFPVLVALFLVSPFSYGDEEKEKVSVAKVDYSEIDNLVEEIVLSRPENKELGERFLAGEKKAKEAQERMQQAMMNGEKFNPMEAAAGMMNQSKDKEKVEMLCEKHVLEVIERAFSGQYQLILKEGFRGSLLYTEIPIDDVTDLLRQALLKELPAEGKK